MPMYEFVDSVAVPPQAVRERLRMPAKFQMSTLHKDRKGEFPEVFYDTAVRYLKDYVKAGKSTQGILFAGPVGSRTSHVAAALLNEVVLRSEGKRDITGTWLSGFYVLRMILDAKELGRKELYQSIRTRCFNDEALVVDDLLSAARTLDGKLFLETVYAYRADHNLPTITTVTTPAGGAEITKLVEKEFGKVFSQRLLQSTAGYRAKL